TVVHARDLPSVAEAARSRVGRRVRVGGGLPRSQSLARMIAANKPIVKAPSCRFCAAPLETSFVDLGMSPLCQTHIEPEQLNHMEPFYPLHALVCGKCFLVELQGA